MVRAWYMDSDVGDQRLEHQLDPSDSVSIEQLRDLGVLYWYFDPDNYDKDPKYAQLKAERGYTYQDQIQCSPDKLEDYESKLKMFFEEHTHRDEEIRFVLDGSGYFDVRDPSDRWIRIEMVRGDMIVLPAGIFHRFTLDTKDYIKALRLFVGEPVWTAYPRQHAVSVEN